MASLFLENSRMSSLIHTSGQRESFFQSRDENESFSDSISFIETRPRVPDTYSRASRRDRDLLSSLSGIETRTRIPLIWSRFSRQDREFWNSPSFPEIRIERPHYFACNFWEANYIKWRAPHFARCARLTWITWLPCISSIAFIPCLICITCITFITWLSITSLNSLLIRIFKMYNLPIEANLWSDSKKKWLPCVSDFEAYWLASKWLRWKIDYLESRAVITELILSHKLYLWRKKFHVELPKPNNQQLLIGTRMFEMINLSVPSDLKFVGTGGPVKFFLAV